MNLYWLFLIIPGYFWVGFFINSILESIWVMFSDETDEINLGGSVILTLIWPVIFIIAPIPLTHEFAKWVNRKKFK